MVNFSNKLGKRVKFWLSNEVLYIKDEDFEKMEHFKFEVEPNQEISFTNDTKLQKAIVELMSSFKEDDLAKAQLYMNIKVEGPYEMTKNFPIYQIGLFSYKLKKIRNSYRSQYYLLHLTREIKETTISFESLCVLFNNTSQLLRIDAFTTNNHNSKEYLETKELKQSDVVILPLTWFEMNVHLCLS